VKVIPNVDFPKTHRNRSLQDAVLQVSRRPWPKPGPADPAVYAAPPGHCRSFPRKGYVSRREGEYFRSDMVIPIVYGYPGEELFGNRKKVL
jgi:hypothetical protein